MAAHGQTRVPSPDSGRFDVIPYSDLSPEASWRTLGRGSFGKVFRGLYLGLDVAIKEVLDSDEYDVDKYFRRECTLMKECRHPNIVQFIGLCLASPVAEEPPSLQLWEGNTQTSAIPIKPARRRILIISEYLPNGNVRSYIANPKLPFGWRLRLSFSIDVTRALAYLHARNCLHRDLKGENMLITENDRIKVCDFGFARIAARNEEEMRRISYCGTDGYMAPEILMGDEFGLEVDIFSLGVIFCEILSRRLVDDYTFKREMPSFGLDSEEIRGRASTGCPASFIDLAISCVAAEPRDRPKIRTVLEKLMEIEREVIEAESANGPAYNVGSLTFTARNTGRRGNGKRPAGPPRIPSFQGQIEGPKYSDSEKEDIGETSDEDVDDTLAKLSKLQIGNGRAGSAIYLDPRNAEATSRLASRDAEEAGIARPSTYSVIKGSKIANRSSIIHKDSDFVDAPLSTSSIVTVKPCNSAKESFATPSSLPSLPSSWLRMGKQAPGSSADISEDADDKTENVDDGLNTSDDVFLSAGSIVPGIRADEESTDAASDTIEQSAISAEAIEDSKTSTLENDEATAPSAILAATIATETTIDKFATIKSLSTPPPPVDSDILPMLSPTKTGKIFSPHRFTLIRPGWKGLWEGPAQSKDKGRNGKGGSAAGGLSLAAILPAQLLGAGLLARCCVCEKRLGLMKPYLSCDDCQNVYHVRCGDLTSPDCRVHTHKSTLAGSETNVVNSKPVGKDKSKRVKGESKRLSKSPRSSLIAV